MTHSSYAGQHRYGTITWSGDVSATWEVLRRHVPEDINFCATGEPYWSTDIGAFFPNDNRAPMLRQPALVFPQDKALHKIDDQMMLGDYLLAKPITRPMYYFAQFTADKPCLNSTEDDMIFLDAQLSDSQDRPVLENGRRVIFQVEGGAVFMGAGSGALFIPDNYTSPTHTLENGLAHAVERVKPGATGSVTITCTSEGMADAVLTLPIK